MNIERNYLRRSYRINLPAYVTVDNETYTAKDWSFLGFRIDTKGKKFEQNRTYEVMFELPFAGFDMRFKTKAVCKWTYEKEAGFEFTELSDEIKLVMKEYVEAYIEGRLQNTGGILKAAEGIEIPVDTKTKLSEEERKKLDKTFIKRTFFYLILLSAVLFAVYKIYQNKNLVYSSEAFISGNYYNIPASAEGEITKIEIQEGDNIDKNTVIAVIVNQKLKDEIKELNQTKSVLISQLNSLIKLSNGIKAPSSEKPVIQELINIISQKEKLLQKQQKLFKLGVLGLSTLQKTESDIQNLKLKLKILKNTNKNTSYRQLKTNLKINILNLKNKIDTLNIKIKNIQSKLQQKVYSPYSGKILNIYKHVYDYVKRNDPIATVNLNASKVYVIGRFKYKDALHIYINDKADVYIPSLNKTYKGKVTSVGMTALNGEIPNDTVSYTRKDIPVKIEITDPDKKLMPGIAAEITITGNE